MENNKIQNVHYLIDFEGCDSKQLDSVDFWKKTLTEAAEKGDLGVIGDLYHKFEPQGVTAILLLSASHLSIHSWPEDNFLACDLFSCGGDENAKKALDYLLKSIKHEKYKIKKVIRH